MLLGGCVLRSVALLGKVRWRVLWGGGDYRAFERKKKTVEGTGAFEKKKKSLGGTEVFEEKENYTYLIYKPFLVSLPRQTVYTRTT